VPRPLSVLLKIIIRSLSTKLIKNAFMNTSDIKNTFSLLFPFHSFSSFLFCLHALALYFRGFMRRAKILSINHGVQRLLRPSV